MHNVVVSIIQFPATVSETGGRDDDDVFKQLLSQAAAAVEAKDHRMEDLLGLQEQMKKMNLSIAETIARLSAKLEQVPGEKCITI